jgi:hypothetical protein
MKIDTLDLAVIEFDYVNWRDEPHHYAIDIESIEYADYGPKGKVGPDVKPRWVMHGSVILRDGKPREVPKGETNRRTFLMEKMGNLKEYEG